MESILGQNDEGQARLEKASTRMTEALVRASERIELMNSRDVVR